MWKNKKMIISKQPISLAEIPEFLDKDNSANAELAGFIKKFSELKKQDAEKLKEEIKSLNLLKVKDEHIVKIIDLLPSSKEELNKVFVDIGLDEDESKIILEKIKNFK